jgi:ABC-type phosphate/phosphonate transport system substrate-binding protein
MRPVRNSFIALALALLSGCATAPSSAPVTLRIAVNDIYCTETACTCVHDVAARNYSQALARLREESGVELKFDYFMEPYRLEDAILSGNYDGILSKPWTALRLQQQSGASFQHIVDVLDPNENRGLTGIVIVRTDSPFQTLKDLNGKHVYIGQPDAYEKHQAAKRLFETMGIHPSKIDMNASCSENIGVLLDHVADATVVSDYALAADCAVDFANPADFRTLAHTEPIPLTSLMLDMNRVDEAMADRVQKALLAVSGQHAPESLLSNGFIEPAPWNPPELEALP